MSLHTPVYTFEMDDEALVEEFLEYVKRIHVSKRGGAQAISDRIGHDVELQKFKAWCEPIFESVGHKCTIWDFWCSILTSKDTNARYPNFCQGFPHNHTWNGMTLILYLQVPEEGGDLVVIDEDGTELERVHPKVGLAATVGGWDEHGVETIYGDTARITLITTVFPEERKKS